MADLSEVITESIADAELPVETPEPEPTPETPVEAAPETPAEPTPETPAETPQTPEPTVDEFERLAGIPSVSLSGRENRIPYSRSKKITEKAVGEVAEAALGRKLAPGERAVDVVRAHVGKFKEAEDRIRDYEEKLTRVDNFEKIMVNNPDQFLEMLSTIPVYKPFFKAVDEAIAAKRAGQAPPQAPAETPVDPTGEMPQPNQRLSDGSMVYDNEGVEKLLEWKAAQVEARVIKKIEERYKPLESAWQAEERVKQVIPQVQAQVAEARTWPMFTDNEQEIIKVLQADPRISLERAYQKVVYPQFEGKIKDLTTDRAKMREAILKEIQQAPRSTAAPVASSKPVSDPGVPKSLEQIISESIQTLK